MSHWEQRLYLCTQAPSGSLFQAKKADVFRPSRKLQSWTPRVWQMLRIGKFEQLLLNFGVGFKHTEEWVDTQAKKCCGAMQKLAHARFIAEGAAGSPRAADNCYDVIVDTI